MKLIPNWDGFPGFAVMRLLGVMALVAFAGCTTNEPKKPKPNDWIVPHQGGIASNPPPRLTSKIAPPPTTDFERPTNAPAPGSRSLNDSLDQLKAAPSAEPQKRFSFSAKDLDVKDALALFARSNDLNIVPDPDISGKVTVDFRNLPLEKSMEAILDTFGYFAEIDGGLIRVRKMRTEFFTVDYIRLNRTGNGSTSANISSGSGSGGGSGVGSAGGVSGGGSTSGGISDGTSVSISKTDNIKFWDELEE